MLLCNTPAGLKRGVPGKLIELLPDDPHVAMPLLKGLPGVEAVMVFGEALRVLVREDGPDAEQLARAAAEAGVHVERASEARMDMEVAFSYLVERERAGRLQAAAEGAGAGTATSAASPGAGES